MLSQDKPGAAVKTGSCLTEVRDTLLPECCNGGLWALGVVGCWVKGTEQEKMAQVETLT